MSTLTFVLANPGTPGEVTEAPRGSSSLTCYPNPNIPQQMRVRRGGDWENLCRTFAQHRLTKLTRLKLFAPEFLNLSPGGGESVTKQVGQIISFGVLTNSFKVLTNWPIGKLS